MINYNIFRIFRKVPKNILLLGIISFFQNLSSTPVSSLSGIMLNYLGGDSFTLGIIRGPSEALSYILKIFSGYFSDVLRTRKSIIVIGYWLAFFSKFLFFNATKIWLYGTAQTIDRFANGVRDTPRDTLLLEDCRYYNYPIGRAVALRQILASFGSVFGGVLCFFLIGNNLDFIKTRKLYLLFAIPVLVAATMTLFIKNTPSNDVDENIIKKPRKKNKLSDMKYFPKTYWMLILTLGIVLLTRFSESFFTWYALKGLCLSTKYQPLILVLYYFASIISSLFAGKTANKFNCRILTVLNYLAVTFGYILISFSANGNSVLLFICGLLLCGFYNGAVNILALIAIEYVIPRDSTMSGTALGVFGIISGISMVTSSLIFGHMTVKCLAYDFANAFAKFAYLGLFSSVLILYVMKKIMPRYIPNKN